jgi:PHD/YefM family antitoxin component YafN of YafNO toxin-antitoxin module
MERAQGIKKEPDIIFRDGKPTAVIVDIKEYQEMLERLTDIEEIIEHIEIARVVNERLKDHNIEQDVPWEDVKRKYGL